MSGSGSSTNGAVRETVDTNIVVYAYDPRDAEKHRIARELPRRLSDEGRLVLSVQVFNEFASVMRRPRGRTPLPPEEIAGILRGLAATGTVVPITPAMTFLAHDALPRHGLSFWDALIWAAARENGLGTVYTEDFQAGRDLDGVRLVDPFADGA